MPIDVTLALDKIELIGRPKDKLTKAEPNMWTVFFKFDGAKLSIGTDLQIVGEAEIRASSGTHESLDKAKVKKDGSAPIPPELGSFKTSLVEVPFGLGKRSRTQLSLAGKTAQAGVPPLDPNTLPDLPNVPDIGKTLPDLDDLADPDGGLSDVGELEIPIDLPDITVPSLLAPVVGVIYVVTEFDFSDEETLEAGHAAFNKAIETALEGVLVSVNQQGIQLNNPALSEEEQRALATAIEEEVLSQAEATAKENFDVGSAVDPDDFIGAAGHVFTSLDFAGGSSIPILDKFDTTEANNVGVWEVHGAARPS